MVLASYEEDDDDPRDQRVTALCTRCGEEWRYHCTTGAARMHIATFARTHRALHDGPFGDGKK
jgi:hypothetical protein